MLMLMAMMLYFKVGERELQSGSKFYVTLSFPAASVEEKDETEINEGDLLYHISANGQRIENYISRSYGYS